MQSTHDAVNLLFIFTRIVHTLLMLAILVVVWIGWLRQRHMGFLLLVGWALVALINVVGTWTWMPIAQNLMLKIFPGASSNYVLRGLPSVASSLLSTLLLLTGLAMLVFHRKSENA